VNLVDVIIVVFAVAFAVIGYERGLMASALPLAGFVVGAALGGRLGPALLGSGGESRYAPALTVLCGLMVGTVLAVLLRGVAELARARLVARRRALGHIDGVGGSLLLVALALALAWAFGAAALNSSGPGSRDLRDALQGSRILAALNRALPPSGPILNLLRHVDPTVAIRGPRANVRTPRSAIARDPDVARAGGSVVKVLGTACGLGIEGSGWTVGPGLVVTNAHVVAGELDTTVTTRAGVSYDAGAVRYQPRDDLAILRVPGLNTRALPIAARARSGTAGAVLGYPENGPFTITPARLGSTGTALSQDSYGRGPVKRVMTPFRGPVRSGNSGGPVVDGAGRVLTTVFAAEERRSTGGLGVPNAAVSRALDGRLVPTGTGPCGV
jgi:S1-C subfamily serine protease